MINYPNLQFNLITAKQVFSTLIQLLHYKSQSPLSKLHRISRLFQSTISDKRHYTCIYWYDI